MFNSRPLGSLTEREVLAIYHGCGMRGDDLVAFAQRLYARVVGDMLGTRSPTRAEARYLERVRTLLYSTSEARIARRELENTISPFHFKYARRDHAEAMVACGQIRVGNLVYYRNVEELGPEVGDAEEAMKETIEDIAFLDLSDPDSASWMMQGEARRLALHTEDVAYLNNRVIYREISENAYVNCLSRGFDERAMQEMGYDTAVLIRVLRAFALAAHEAMLQRIRGLPNELRVGNCRYTGRRRSPGDDPIGPAWLKEPRHAAQNEARLLWSPTPTPIDPKDRPIVESAEIAAACEIVSPSDYAMWSERTSILG